MHDAVFRTTNEQKKKPKKQNTKQNKTKNKQTNKPDKHDKRLTHEPISKKCCIIRQTATSGRIAM